MSPDDVPYRAAGLELMAELEADIAVVLKERCASLPPETATEISVEVTRRIGQRWGGLRVYIPRSLVIDQIHWQIYQEFNGRNKMNLARKYGMTEVWIDKIIQRCKRIDIGRRQGDIFASDADASNGKPPH